MFTTYATFYVVIMQNKCYNVVFTWKYKKKKNAKINERILLNNMLITHCIIHKNIQDIMKFIRF